jgi:hypothetical protein
MFPNELPSFIRDNPLRSAECKVYDRLRRLPESYAVFYSRPWLGLTRDGSEIDGEADFVVAHPDGGVLTVEVKGGTIIRDPFVDEWTSIDRHGIRHSIKNPVEQARSSKHQILKKLKTTAGWRPRFINARHGVVFPDVTRPSEDLGADMPLRIFAFREDMEHLPDWVVERLGGFEPNDESSVEALGSDGIAALEYLLARPIQLHAPLSGSLASEERQIVVLTEQQFDVLDGLERSRRCSVAGAAGTGKTLLAIEKARRLAVSGRRTLLTCYNQPLASHLKQCCSGVKNVQVMSFHELCGSFARRAGLELAVMNASDDHRSERSALFFSKVLPDALLRALDKLPMSDRFDSIVVDEGQDFLPAWWLSIEMCLRDSDDGEFYIFYDDNQRLYSESKNEWPAGMTSYELTRNLRNTKPIFTQSLAFYEGARLKPGGPDGRAVEWIAAETDVDVRNTLLRAVDQLTGPDQVRIDDIAVLSKKLPPNTSVSVDRLGWIDLTRADRPRAGALVLDTVARFKGLERAVILLLRPGELIDELELLYVGTTRARLHLIVIGAAREIEMVRSIDVRQRSARRRNDRGDIDT